MDSIEEWLLFPTGEGQVAPPGRGEGECLRRQVDRVEATEGRYLFLFIVPVDI